MIRRCVITSCLLLVSVFISSQEIISSYTNYFENTREVPHLHLNKTSLLKGEEIWFQAYVLEQNSSKPHPTSSNLYVSVFEESGKLKDQHLIKIENGIGRGNFLIDSTFTNNNYYIKASTNWMKNFNEDNAFYQKIKIIASTEDKTKIEVSSLKEEDYFEFQLFPEGGHFLANTNNSVGILIKDAKNKGIKIEKGSIKNEKNQLIKTFKTNQFGLGKIDVFMERNKSYLFEATLPNGSILKKKINKIRNIGVLLKVVEKEKNFEIRLETNPSSLKLLNKKNFNVLIHNTRKYKKLSVAFNDKNNTYILLADKNELYKGINIITLFNDEQKPISERLIFNNSKALFAEVSIDKMARTKDSITLKFTNNSDDKINVSTSFLPKNTKAYNANNNITTSFLLKPYLRGKIENAKYYFDDKNSNRVKDLDFLLLTQGWSKYSWEAIFRNKPKINYPFENGIDINFKLNKPIRKKQKVLIFSKENNIIREIKPDQNPFKIKNTFITKKSKITFSLKQENKSFKVSPSISFSNHKINDRFNFKRSPEVKKELEISNFKNLTKGVQMLNEVVIVGNKKFVNETKGLSKAFKKMNFTELPFSKGNFIDFINPILRYYAYTVQPLNKFFLNGEDISRERYRASGLQMDQIREIRMGTSISGLGREMHIYTYSVTEYIKLNIKSTEIELPIGFAQNKEYYTPKYPSFTEESYTNYGAIFWKSNITINAKSSLEFKTPSNYQDEFKVFIEGITESGKLITTKKVF